MACDALAAGAYDTEKYIMIIGLVETVALFFYDYHHDRPLNGLIILMTSCSMT